MPDYTVHLAVESDDGATSYTFTVDQGDAPDLVAGPVVLDGATIGWEFAGDDWPPVLQAHTGTVQLLAQDVADLAGLDTAQKVALIVLDDTETKVGALFGRVSELTADHVRRPDPADTTRDILWTRYTLSLVDYLPTLDLPIISAGYGGGFDSTLPGPVNVVAGSMDVGLPDGASMTEPLSYGGASWDFSTGSYTNPYQVEPGTWSSARLVAEIQAKVLPLAIGYDSNELPHFYLAVPVVDLPDLSTPYIDPPPVDHLGLLALRGPFSAELPCTAVVEGGVLVLAPVPTRPNCLDAGRIAESGQWRRDGARAVGAVTVYRPTADARTTVKDAAAPIDHRTRDVEADLTTASAAATLATAYLVGDAAEVQPAWELESFTLKPEAVSDLADPDSLWTDFWIPAAWDSFPWPYSVNPRYRKNTWTGGTPDRPAPQAYRVPVAIFGLQEGANLTGQGDLYAGTLSGARMTINRGEVSVSFALRRRIPRPEGDSTDWGRAWVDEFGTPTGPVLDASYAWARATIPTVTYRGAAPVVDPDMTLRDFRLVRKVS